MRQNGTPSSRHLDKNVPFGTPLSLNIENTCAHAIPIVGFSLDYKK